MQRHAHVHSRSQLRTHAARAHTVAQGERESERGEKTKEGETERTRGERRVTRGGGGGGGGGDREKDRVRDRQTHTHTHLPHLLHGHMACRGRARGRRQRWWDCRSPRHLRRERTLRMGALRGGGRAKQPGGEREGAAAASGAQGSIGAQIPARCSARRAAGMAPDSRAPCAHRSPAGRRQAVRRLSAIACPCWGPARFVREALPWT